MAEAQQPPEAPPPSSPSPPARPAPLAAALPYLATAVAAVLASLLIQNLLWPRPPAAAPLATAPPAVPTATGAPAAASATSAPGAPTAPAPSPAPTSAATPAPADEGLLRLEILDLEAADRRLWSALYLLRAATQIDDAIVALQGNDLAEADRTLLTAYRSLDRAYAVSAESDKGPIDTFRMQLSRIRDDLSIRPEGADRRLRQLRQLMLSLVDEGS